MNLYFIKRGNSYLTKTSKIFVGPEYNNPINLSWTFDISEARYWDNIASVKAQATKLRNLGFEVHIVVADVKEKQLGETF